MIFATKTVNAVLINVGKGTLLVLPAGSINNFTTPDPSLETLEILTQVKESLLLISIYDRPILTPSTHTDKI